MTRALVVDDDESLRSMMAEALENYGYGVRTAKNGAEALTLVADVAPDVIVLDLIMPEVDGEDFLRLLGFFERVPPRKIVMVTADKRAEQHIHGLRVDCILSKPFELDELYEAVGPPRDDSC